MFTHTAPKSVAFPPLLLWQQFFLFFMAGILATQNISLACVLFSCIFLWIPSRYHLTPRFILALGCGILGFCYTQLHTPQPPSIPAWLQNHILQVQQSKNGQIQITALVQEVIPRTPSLTRIILTDIQPVPYSFAAEAGTSAAPIAATNADATTAPTTNTSHSAIAEESISIAPTITTDTIPITAPATPSPSTSTSATPTQNTSAPYRGNVLWNYQISPTQSATLQNSEQVIPIAGQRIAVTLKISPVQGFINPGTLDTEQFWHQQNIWLRASALKKAPIIILSPAPFGQSLRTRLLEQCYLLLPRYSPLSTFNTPNQNIATKGAYLLPALLFGDKSHISPEDTERIGKSTLAHSLSLSGLHLGYMAAFGMAISWLIAKAAPNILLRIPFTALSMLISFPLAIGYVWLASAPISLQRSFLMLAFWGLLFVLHKPKVFLDGLFAALAMLLLLNPLALFDLSLQLSALSIAVIALSLPFIQQLNAAIRTKKLAAPVHPLHHASPWWNSPLMHIFWMSLSIQIVLSPLVTRTFGLLGIWFPLNLLWLPILGCIVMPLAFFALLLQCLGLYSLASWLYFIAAIPCDALLLTLQYMESFHILWAPAVLRLHPISIAGFWLLCLALPSIALARIANRHSNGILTGSTYRPPLLQRLYWACAYGILLFVVPLIWTTYANPPQGVRIRLLDVGAAQAVLIDWRINSSTGCALIDGGGAYESGFNAGKSIVLPTIADNSLPRIKAAIVSHPDMDHMGGMLPILQFATVTDYYTNADTPTPALQQMEKELLTQQKRAKKVLHRGDFITLHPDLRLEVLWPPANGPLRKSRNQNSLVLRLLWQNVPLALFCGDIESQQANALAQMHDAPVKPAAISKGSAQQNSTTTREDTIAVNGIGTTSSASNTTSNCKREIDNDSSDDNSDNSYASGGSSNCSSDGSASNNSSLQAAVLVLPHHGSNSSYATKLYELVAPSVALQSASIHTIQPLQRNKVQQYFLQHNIPFYSTATHGQVTIQFSYPHATPQTNGARTALPAQ